MNRKEHWEGVYESKAPDDVSWFQPRPETSLRLLAAAGLGKQEGVIDVGGGASVLVDCLLDAGFTQLAVLDLSGVALALTRRRLGARAAAVHWFEADVTEFRPPERFALWHDRAVFHFLTTPTDRTRYVASLKASLVPGGHVIIATFALDGPAKCSGLEVARYDAAGVGAELGAEFRICEQVDETHLTPWQTEQRFSYFRFQRQT
ncbi:MAG: class I SAM-dependent methyltransferase [Limisphaerales bacterium]